jgi:hypothetical protein
MGKIVWYFGGGNTRSIYGSGIVKGIADRMTREELFEKTRCIIAGSGGLVNVAGLVSGQAEIPGEVCMNDLQEGFVSYWGAINRIFRGFAKKAGMNFEVNDGPNCVEIDQLMKSLRDRGMNYKAVEKCPVPIKGKLFDVKQMRITYLDLRTDPERILRQGVSISPYFTSKEDKIDGEALEPLGVEYMLSQMRPEDKLVGVMNYPPLKGVKHSLKRWLESNVGEEVYPGIGEIISKKDEKFRREVRVIKQLVKEGRALLSHPPKSDPTRSRTTDRRKLEITYATGERNSEEIVEFVRNAEN